MDKKDLIIYFNTGFVIDFITCKGYKNEEEAIKDLRLKFDNYNPNFIVTREDYLKYKNKIKG